MRIITVNLPISCVRELEDTSCSDGTLFTSRSESIRNAFRYMISQLIENLDLSEFLINEWKKSFEQWRLSNDKKMAIITINIPEDYLAFLDKMVSDSVVGSRSEAARIAIHAFMQNEKSFLNSMQILNAGGILQTKKMELVEPTENQIRQIMQARGIPIYSHGDTVYMNDNGNITIKTIKRKAETYRS